MRLTDLNPRWLTPNVFVFECPCGCYGTPRALWLSCKNIVLPSHDQFELFATTIGEDWNMTTVPMKAEFAWTFSGSDFSMLTVTPSIDASASGHWHGFITNGVVR
jgi:hypothetical protein